MTNSHIDSFVQRIENLNEERQTLADDIKSVYEEAKDNGLSTKALRRLVTMRKKKLKNPVLFKTEEDDFDVYAAAVKLFE